MSSAMLHKSYFTNWCLWFIFFCSLLSKPVKCTQTSYKLVGEHDDAVVTDSNVPFLRQSFFTCELNEDCTKVAKIKGSSEFKEVIGQQAVEEDAVVFEKVSTRGADEYPTWSAWNIGKCSVKCGGGKQTFKRYCYSHLPCLGKSSKVEECNKKGCPELYKCKHATTGFADGLSSTHVRSSGKGWLPLVDLKPSCNSSDHNSIMTKANLEKSGTDIRYNYSCCSFKGSICHAMFNSTNWSSGHSGSNSVILRHPIDCGEFAFISSFQLERKSTNIRYSYTCCDVVDQKWKDLMQCTYAKRLVAFNGFHTLSLAEVEVSCDAGFGLSSLKLHADYDIWQWGFEFRCCKIAY